MFLQQASYTPSFGGLGLGVKKKGMSNQRVLSAALQVLIGFHSIGGELTYRFADRRYGPRKAKV